MSAATSPVAYSYIRFSSPRQAEGDSLRRQTDAAAEWCKRNRVHLDTSLTLHDLGKSAFTGKHRQNPDRNALAAFLKLVEQGRVPKGSYFIVEALDRLSREHIIPALSLLLSLIQDGLKVVQLKPVEAVYGDDAEPMQLMMGLMELSRGNSESLTKSGRCREAWSKKKDAARSGAVMSNNLPRWVESHGGKLRLIPDRAAIVKRVFALAASGHGLVSIARTLTAEGIPSFGGRRETWTRSYLALILKDRRALGEHQPRTTKPVRVKRKGDDGTATEEPVARWVPDGAVIPNYYPAVVTEEEWLAAGAGRQDRTKRRGRVGKHVNIFAGLLRSASDGGPYHLNTWRASGRLTRALLNFRSVEGLAPCRSFPYDPLETAVLKLLREINPREVLGREAGPDRLAVIAGELAQVDGSIAVLVADMDAHGESPTLFKRLREKEQRRAELVAEQVAERQKAAAPAAEAWGEVNSLAELLDNAPDADDVRLKIRSALRRIVTEAWMLVVPRPPTRLAALQFHFEGGPVRHFLVSHTPPLVPKGKLMRPARSEALSFVDAGLPSGRDLRKQVDAAALEKLILKHAAKASAVR
ncbi:MAG: recombinase family protein [Gemmataceae bacterium]|nr:recombinase family protein [Gemmataceae bacterium]